MKTKTKPNDPCWCGSGKKFKKCHAPEENPQRESRFASGKLGSLLKPRPRKLENANPIQPGHITPMREVPEHIKRPDYALTGTPRAREPRDLRKSEDQIARMRKACKLARHVLNLTLEAVKPGITTEELDAIAHEETIRHDAYPSPLNYRGYPKSICTSINEVICHGIPDDRPLQEGDIVNCDITVYIDGMHGDCSETIAVGEVDQTSQNLMKCSLDSLNNAIKVVKPGSKVRDIGRAIEEVAKGYPFSVVRDFTGHGIGEIFHMKPNVFHYYNPSATMELQAGMTFTIEPMINQGTWKCDIWDDDWTAVTQDLGRSAQFEHTLLVTPKGVEILTAS